MQETNPYTKNYLPTFSEDNTTAKQALGYHLTLDLLHLWSKIIQLYTL